MTEAVTEPESDTVVEEPEQAPPAGPSLHQPRRWLIAAGEAVAIVLLVVLAVWCWNRGVVRLEYPFEGREPLTSTRYLGNWLGTAAGAVTLAVVLALDAVRQVLLAVRTRPQKAADSDM
ncbi:hypothetical protein [Lentzea flaviverrucosa]|uniref:Uncharacterized protein n=1 Tax=Lentzea flaviverrucosa TaxID=200379 RepID=A0A1H9P3S3_9PSEU|nr:hypothetical protein [Lentzea flaviverrucosa]RDI29993.1 hypothetical protein DFR72_105416 [Lentzea flaviverrucosa]SER42479.1 hypothetical protein SAMN05216195_105156 [Lentzea flaviverrucosa]